MLSVLDKAYAAHTGFAGLAGFFDAETGAEAVDAAQLGDTLALFVVRELNDLRDGDDIDLGLARAAILRACTDLFALQYALAVTPDPETIPPRA